VADEGRVGAVIHVASPPLRTPMNQKPPAPDTLKFIHPIALRQAILPIVRTSRSGVGFGLFLSPVECITSVSSTQLN
jgi:hypothetical protein